MEPTTLEDIISAWRTLRQVKDRYVATSSEWSSLVEAMRLMEREIAIGYGVPTWEAFARKHKS